MDYIFGMRAVIEALATGKDIDKILVKKDLSGDLSNELFAALAFLSAVAYHNLDKLIPELFE